MRGFIEGVEVVQHVLLVHVALPIVQLHVNVAPNERNQVGLCYSTNHAFLQTLAKKALLCVKIKQVNATAYKTEENLAWKSPNVFIVVRNQVINSKNTQKIYHNTNLLQQSFIIFTVTPLKLYSGSQSIKK